MATAIDIQGVSKLYRSRAIGMPRIVRAVDKISLQIKPGELFFLLGPSGCGKTTLLRMIAGFIDPTAGTILFDGRDVTHAAPNKRNTGMVFQSYALWPHMTVAQNVAFGLSVRRVARQEREARVVEALRAVRMVEYASRKPMQLSGGQQQRVALARALVVRPDVLLLDEPLSNLDAKLRMEMRSEIRRICAETHITTVYVTHDQKEALSMADRIAVLDRGKVAQIGTPKDLYLRPGSRFVADFLGETNFLSAEVVGEVSGGGGAAAPRRLRLRTPAGELLATPTNGLASGGAAGKRVTCSVRPESWRLVEPTVPGALVGRVVESVFLGDAAQHVVNLPGREGEEPLRVRVSVLHPTTRHGPSGDIGLAVAPEDVVIVGEQSE